MPSKREHMKQRAFARKKVKALCRKKNITGKFKSVYDGEKLPLIPVPQLIPAPQENKIS